MGDVVSIDPSRPRSWSPKRSDTPRRGNTAVLGSDPEPLTGDTSAASRRTLYCRDSYHNDCSGMMEDFDFIIRRQTRDDCGCSCHRHPSRLR